MYKIRINSRIKALFLAIIGIFSMSFVKIHGDYEYLNSKRFIAMLYDEEERTVFKRLYNYMNTTRRLDRKYEIRDLLPKEFNKMFEHRKSGYMYALSERGFKYALGEVLHKVIPAFPVWDEDALMLAAIYLGVEFETLRKALPKSEYQYIMCRGYNYSGYYTLIEKFSHTCRFDFISFQEYIEIIHKDK